MPGLMSEEDLLSLLDRNNESQLPVIDPQQLMLQLLMNPNKVKKVQSRIVEHSNNGILKQNIIATRVNEYGVVEEIQEEVQYLHMLADGTALGDLGIVKCQNCGKIVSVQSIHRCTCGKTVCVLCGTYSEANEQWYCGFWHKLLGGKVS